MSQSISWFLSKLCLYNSFCHNYQQVSSWHTNAWRRAEAFKRGITLSKNGWYIFIYGILATGLLCHTANRVRKLLSEHITLLLLTSLLGHHTMFGFSLMQNVLYMALRNSPKWSLVCLKSTGNTSSYPSLQPLNVLEMFNSIQVQSALCSWMSKQMSAISAWE